MTKKWLLKKSLSLVPGVGLIAPDLVDVIFSVGNAVRGGGFASTGERARRFLVWHDVKSLVVETKSWWDEASKDGKLSDEEIDRFFDEVMNDDIKRLVKRARDTLDKVK